MSILGSAGVRKAALKKTAFVPAIFVLVIVTVFIGSGSYSVLSEEERGCAVEYVISSQWNTGFTSEVTIRNHTDAAIEGWTLSWSHPGGQQVDSGWNAEVIQTGNEVQASNPAGHWNGTIASGESVTFGFQGTHGGQAVVPSGFVLNGSACSSDGSGTDPGEPEPGDPQPGEPEPLDPDAITGETMIGEMCPNFRELYVDRTFLDYLPGDGGGGHGGHEQTSMTDKEKAELYGFNVEAVKDKVGDGSLALDDLGTQALGHVRELAANEFPAHAICQLLPRLALLGDEAEEPTYHKSADNPWEETAGPAAATNDPDLFLQEQWPTDARTYLPPEKAERDRCHDQPVHENGEGWTFTSSISRDVLYDPDNPVLHAVREKVHPVTGEPLGGAGFTSNAPMEAEARMHVENEGFWYQVVQFKNTSPVPYHLDCGTVWWVGPSSLSFDLRNGHYNNEQRPSPGYGHPQRDIIEVVFDEEKELSVYVIRLAFHDEPYNMRTAYPNQYWSLEVGLPARLSGERYTTSAERQEVVDMMLNTLHVELETGMDRNIDLLDTLNLRNRVSN
ncbi:Cellulose binding domain-containing protein [Evansella caseinilytica]|uniref:Cellulose binding domain-containing protein n=1 Tax=Evansella caseinilytica TaxID=1503961 RepID=A0A1H3PYK0_9BACI|nr:cellulose-binding domain-containing protein [Evansella caseinilytica]SDZ05489.1 Cellulose binding domain-containing protein [Evansella caseinilytica]